MENLENKILIDWLTFSSKQMSVQDAQQFLGMCECTWESLGGLNGYRDRLHFHGISICYNGREDMGICINLSGSGCRAFETYGTGDWLNTIRVLLADPDDYNITRLDIAYDDHTGILDIDRLKLDVDEGYFSCKARWWKIEYGTSGTTIYFGSPKSDIRVRIYDKAAERGFSDRHWIRVELQLRDDRARKFLEMVVGNAFDVGGVFSGVIANYLNFKEPSPGDTNKSRWPVAVYWSDFIGAAAPISLWEAPGEEYNVYKLQGFLVDQAGAALTTFDKLFGVEKLMQLIKQKNPRLNDRYRRLIDDFFRAR